MADAPAPHHALVMQFVAALLQRTLDGFVANFAQEVMKGQLPPSVGGLGGQRVE